jgi:hypothetical protein
LVERFFFLGEPDCVPAVTQPVTASKGSFGIMTSQMTQIERAARMAMGGLPGDRESDPLPPAPNYGPFGYFRLAVLAFAVLVAAVLVLSWL